MLREKTWDKNIQLLLVAIIAFNILPHISDIPVWASAIAYFFLAWKTLALTRGLVRPPTWFLWGASIGCSAGVFFEYRTLIGQDSASALLVTLASAKLLETNRYRDAMFVIFTSFFLLMAHLLSSQSLLSTVFMAVDVLLITALMFQLHKQERRKSARAFRPVMKMLALAIPIWIFLFVAFPRFSAGLWRLQSAQQAGSGFSENLDPGEISQLTDSQEAAFRINFSSEIPSPEDLYWRGAVLTVADGLKWSKAKTSDSISDTLVTPDTHFEDKTKKRKPVVTSYQSFLEPRFRNWIFVLDYPETFSASTRLAQVGTTQHRGFIYEAQRALVGRGVFDASSSQSAPLQRLGAEERAELLKIPDSTDPRILALGKLLAEQAKAIGSGTETPTFNDKVADRGLKWLIDQKFRYTKSPGSMLAGSGSQQLAQFLFEKKVGFCEHYSAAFATLMRAAGVPSRVTVGFQGGIRNDYGNYWLVRDLDAHAWTEIWRDDPDHAGSESRLGRWVRVDPTSVIAPLRLRLGGEFNLLNPNEQASLDPSQFQAQLSARSSQLYWKAQAAWDAVQMNWNSFLNDYDFEFQKSLLEKLGMPEVTRFLLFCLVGLGIVLFIVVVSFALRRRAHKVDPLIRAWRTLCHKIKRAGLERDATEGPLDFAERVALKYPHSADEIVRLANTFAELRYGETTADTKTKMKTFRQSVRRFSIRASS